MVEKTVTVINRMGLHARPSALIVQETKNFKCNIFLQRGKNRINAKSILGVITMGAPYGAKITIIADGEGEQEAVDIIAALFESGFSEDEEAMT